MLAEKVKGINSFLKYKIIKIRYASLMYGL